MMQYVLLAFALCVGYAIPVACSLAFSFAVGGAAPGSVARGGRLRPFHLVLQALVWLLSATCSGYLVALIAGPAAWVFSGVVAVILVTVLWSNANLMRKRQGILQLGGMTLLTAAGTMLGCFLCLLSHR